ncbi:PorV/PorQ family protein [Mucilaginibacter ginkgonis]|uniref:Long-subunit fatty acid transport protein n=1 Tax=Mucilaginibacter ginkgonis TaxID=2682091 RepID=A0A6I4I1W0_9SPHI|nr:hypothetical protein [Mucilaginibacter ginkgonis]QQL48811.1 hypothetical protein GO620_011545 [Mucilaginibacter ginkgonis]
MIKYIRLVITILAFLPLANVVMAQSTATTSSPYSKYGLGTLNQDALPETRAMGGIGTAINKLGFYNYINSANPASYSYIGLTTIDIGLFNNSVTLSQNGVPSQTNSNFRLSHVSFGIPVSKRSALSFGLKPYTELGYNYTQTKSNLGSGLPSDTNAVNYIYSGDGGLSKAYLGYGFGLGKHIAFGANASYIFGNLQQFRSVEIPNLYGNLNTRIEQSNSVSGLAYDAGTQITFDFKGKKDRPGDPPSRHLTFGYSANLSSQLRTQNKYVITQYQKNFATGDENNAADSVVNNQTSGAKIKLPLIHHFGISFQNDGKFLVGADYSIGNWSQLTIAGVNQGLQNTQTFNVGGQFTPNANSINSYLAAVDYRLGFNYEKTYVQINGTNINQKAITFGFGFPLAPSVGQISFYKLNISAEIGERGTLSNNLIRERFYNFHLGFLLNDKWFRRYKFD